MIECLAKSAHTTSSCYRAWIDTLSVEAALLEGAVVVGSTPNQTPIGDANLGEATVLVNVALFLLHPTTEECVTGESFWAPAQSFVVDWHTNGVRAALFD